MAAELTNYTRIKNDVLELLALGLLSKREMQIVHIVIRESWGWEGGGSNWTRKPMRPVDFVERTWMDRANIGRTLANLIERHVILQDAEGRLAFNEHAEEWEASDPLDVAKIATCCQNGNIKLPNQQHEVAKMATSTGPKPLTAAGFQDPKETLKETLKKDTSGGGENVTKKGTYKFTETDLKLAQRLAFRIQQNKPDARLPARMEQWANTIRLMREQDKRKPLRIAQVIDWCQKDPFWCVNILSADKLRIQFDRLELTMNRRQRPAEGPIGKTHTSTVPDADATKAMLARLNGSEPA